MGYTLKSIAPFLNDIGTQNYIIAPDRYSLIVENMIFDALNIKSTFSVQVRGISSIARDILNSMGASEITYTKNESLLAIRKAIIDTSKHFICFKKQITMDFCSEIYNTISQLQSNEVSCDDIENLSLNVSKGLKNKLHDINLIYKRYVEILNGKLDSSALFSLLIEKAKESDLVKNSNFYFVGFDALTKQGYSLVKVLAKNAKSLTFGVVKKSGYRNDYICDEELLTKIKNLDEANEIILDVEHFEDTSSEFSKHIQKNLFLSKIEKKEFNDAFKLIEASSMSIEIEKLCKNIKSLIRKGYRYKDINVVCANEEYIKEIQRKFSDENIINYIDSDIKLSTISYAKMLISSLSFFENPYFINNLFDALDYDFLSLEEEVFSFKNFIDKYGFNGNYLLDENNSFDENKNIIDEIRDLNKKIKSCRTTKDFISLIKEILEKSKIKENSEEILNHFRASLDLKSEKIYVQAYDRLIECLDGFKLIEDECITLEQMIDLLKWSFENFKISSVPVSTDNVYVGNAENSFYDRRKVMFVLGANQNSLPVTLSDLGIISDRDIFSLYELEINPTVAMINRRNRYKLYDILSKAETKLIISYTNTTSDGKNAFVANFAQLLKTAFLNKGGSEVQTSYSVYDSIYLVDNDKKSNFEKLKDNAYSLISAKRELYKIRKNPLNHNEKQILFSSIKKLDNEYNYEIKSIKKDFINFDTKKLFFQNNSTKISQLEKYFECPYKHFIDYGLKLKERKTSRLDARIFGTLLHSIAEIFIKENVKSLGYLQDSEIEEKVEKQFNSILNKSEYSRFAFSQENRVLLYLLKKEAIAFCKEINLQQKYSKFKPEPELLEKFLNFDAFNIDGFKLSIKGVVDRIDLCDNYFRIIDYKSGKIDSSFSALYYGNKVQLFIYQKLVSKFLQKKPAGVFYYSIKKFYEKEGEKPFNLKGIVLDDYNVANLMDANFNVESGKSELLKVSLNKTSLKQGELKLAGKNLASLGEFNKLQEYAYQVCKKACEEILSGYISPSPVKDACEYCEYKCACCFCEDNGSKIRKQPSVTKKNILEAIYE